METRTLSVNLTDQEVIERSKLQAEMIKKIEDLEAEKSEVTKRLGNKAKEMTRELQLVAGEVRSGQKWMEVEVARTKDLKRCVEETVRTDTGEVIETRALTPAEMQLDLVQGGTSTKVKITTETVKTAASGGKKKPN